MFLLPPSRLRVYKNAPTLQVRARLTLSLVSHVWVVKMCCVIVPPRNIVQFTMFVGRTKKKKSNHNLVRPRALSLSELHHWSCQKITAVPQHMTLISQSTSAQSKRWIDSIQMSQYSPIQPQCVTTVLSCVDDQIGHFRETQRVTDNKIAITWLESYLDRAFSQVGRPAESLVDLKLWLSRRKASPQVDRAATYLGLQKARPAKVQAEATRTSQRWVL